MLVMAACSSCSAVYHRNIAITLFHWPLLQVCGMCGNYNQNPSDDNLMPNKKPAKDDIELGNSWKSNGDSDPGSVGNNQ